MSDHEPTGDDEASPLDWGHRDTRWRGIHSDTIDVVGTSIAVLRVRPSNAAPEPAPDNLPVLLVHGVGGAATNWLDVMAPLAEQVGREVVAVDLPGFGDSEPPTPRAARLRPQARFLVRLLDALGWDRAEVHGNSMGGLLATVLAGTQPDRVARLVLVSPALPPPLPGGHNGLAVPDRDVLARFAPFVVSWRIGRSAVNRLYATASPEQVFAGTEEIVMGRHTPMRPAMRMVGVEQASASMQRPWRVDSLSRATESLLQTLATDRAWVQDALAEVAAPILVVWGTADRLVPRGVIDEIVSRRPDATRVDLDRVGHVAMIEVPDRYTALVEDWRHAPTGPCGRVAANGAARRSPTD